MTDRYTPNWYEHDPRFDAITTYLGDRTPHHVLDFGALNHVMAARFVDRYSCHVVAIDDSTELQPTLGVDVDRRRYGPTDLRRLGHFDVTLALSVLHHQKQPKNYLRALVDISEVLFVEIPHPDEILPGVATHKHTPAIQTEIEKLGGTIICETPGWDSRFLRNTYAIT